MEKFKIGDIVRGNTGYSWDPAEGVITNPYGAIKIFKVTKNGSELWREGLWCYSLVVRPQCLTKIPKDKISWLKEYKLWWREHKINKLKE